MFLPHDHAFIKQRLEALLREANVTYYNCYTDDECDTTYLAVGGRSIKFWKVFPLSGANHDRALLSANTFLRPYGLHLAPHNFVSTYRRPVITYDSLGNSQGLHHVDFPQAVYSLVVKPLPTGY